MCEPTRKKKWNDVTVTAWIPSQVCTNLDLFALRLKLTRREALEVILCAVLPEKQLLQELEENLRREL